MSFTESIVEDAALEWFGELGFAVGHGPQLAPGEPAAERDPFSEVVLVGRVREAIPGKHLAQVIRRQVLVGRVREAIRRLNPAIPEEARATIRPYRRVQIERRANP